MFTHKIFIKEAGYNLLIIFLLFFIFINYKNDTTAKNRFCEIYIINNQNNQIKLKVEIADKYETKTKGLMHRKELEKNSGMLFVFENENIQNFWMKNTYIPLSIAYINRKGIINEIYQMKPLDTSVTYPSKKPSLYALEVNKGWFKTNNISGGCRVIFNGCFGKQN